MKNKILIALLCFFWILFISLLIFVILNKNNENLSDSSIDTFEKLLLNNSFEITEQYEAGEEIENEGGNNYKISNKTTYYKRDQIIITLVEVNNVNDVQKELDEYYNFYSSEKILRTKKNYTSIKFVSENRYNCLIGIDKYLIYINMLEENQYEETYNMLVDFINYKYPSKAKE